jgi:hypothetical protein
MARIYVNVKAKSHSAFTMHCVIHRRALSTKTVPSKQQEVLTLAVKVVNWLRAVH